MSGRDVNTSFAGALADEWARLGCTDAVVAPGSRSAPLAIALARHGGLRVHVVVDERSAAFFALGLGKASGRPAVLVCTSGTAAVNFHPAVVEAYHARVPMIVCTADRPPELRDVGAGQTIEQAGLYGRATRWAHDPGPPADAPGVGAVWRALACRAHAAATGPPAGPVHLNLPLREPLVPSGAPLVDAPGRADGRPWVPTLARRAGADPDAVARVAEVVAAHPRGVITVGWGSGVTQETLGRLARATGWPVLADAVSGRRCGPLAISTYEALLRDERFATDWAPDAVLRLGAPLTSKVANAWLDRAPVQVLVDPDDRWLDPARAAGVRVVGDDDALAARVAESAPGRAGAWVEGWCAAERAARGALDAALDALGEAVEGRVARDLAAALPDGANLVVASSILVRALEWCMAPRAGIRIHANRGANGIDGFVSTAFGIAAADAGRPTYALCGDLCFLHDTNGLLAAREAPPVGFVVIDNDGGGIFSFLPPAALPEHEALFATPHGLDLAAVARAHGVAAARGDRPDARVPAETRVLVVPVDRDASVRHHRAVLAAAAAAGAAAAGPAAR
ncbi:MAG: 2-succinyl-5-enolpyruvyl-6-hydroxy-3-cyclohexene-1-carboxylate synthase [Acidimicrobiia bacterium]|nr:MAG: 2-succinyl-5-enolpyruvyl-6-hydroxy-3-cyclohexene-1-carboxylate synthase [Acidimicrobiia bacterium]